MAEINIRTTVTADSVKRLFGPPGAIDYRSHPGQKDSDQPLQVFQNMKRHEVAAISDIQQLKNTVYSFKNRRIITRWLRDVCAAYKLKTTTLCLSIQLTDAFTVGCLKTLPIGKCQLAAVACLWIAAKFEEMDEALPNLMSIVQVCDGAYTAKEVLDMEEQVLVFFKWRLPHTTLINHLYLDLHMLGDPEVVPRGASQPSNSSLIALRIATYDDSERRLTEVEMPIECDGAEIPTLRQLLKPMCAVSHIAVSSSLEVFQLIGREFCVGKRLSLDSSISTLMLYGGEKLPRLLLSTTARDASSVFSDRGVYVILKSANRRLLDLCDVLIEEAVTNVEFLQVPCHVTALGCLALAQCILAVDVADVKPGIERICKLLSISATQALATAGLLVTKYRESAASQKNSLSDDIPPDIRVRLETAFARKLA